MANSPPAYLFVVRHGNRLDAADKRWHLSSPTPYDPPLTYGGFLQARQVGNQIGEILEQAKIDEHESSNGSEPTKKRRRYKIVIHSSPFLRCVQTSVGISSGLAQTSPDSIHGPSDIIVPRATPATRPFQFKSTLLRLDSFLGEWLCPEYFDMITPPPGPALMMGGAKADLLRREDYSAYTDVAQDNTPLLPNSLWRASSPSHSNGGQTAASESNGAFNLSGLASALPARLQEQKSYTAPRPLYAVSSSGKIPEGFVAHARDACVTVDYQWDSMRAPLDFGDGGKLGEEWTAMHTRFRGGLRKLVNWYATTDSSADLVTRTAQQVNGDGAGDEVEDEEVETVVVIVSHGAGCNALIGAITHQPVLLDVGIASITMAARKPNLDYAHMLATAPTSGHLTQGPLVQVDEMYDMRLSASTEHLHSSNSTPVSSRSTSNANVRNAANNGTRGRTSTLGSSVGPAMSPLSYHDPFASPGNRSSSVNAAMETASRQETGSNRPTSRGPAMATSGLANVVGAPQNGNGVPGVPPSFGLWAPTPSSLRLMDDGGDDSDDFCSLLPDFDQKRFQNPTVTQVTDDEPRTTAPAVGETPLTPETDLLPPKPPRSPMLSAPIRIHTDIMATHPMIEEMKMSQLGGGLGGLWGLPPPPDEAERFRDLSHTKRRWTVNERV
ncbi:hypothetical protein HIM_00484 [Hirsutella minnesotensis 3608]|nr:hypothetical protein HIM_00484 [Hirsutella minnesotensis 3608]